LPDNHAADAKREDPRPKRERLLAAAIEVFPTEPIHAYAEASEVYRNLVELGSLDQLQPLLATRLGLVMRRWRKLLDDELKQHGQTLPRWQALFEVAINEPGETLTSIAERIGIVGPTLVGLLDELESDGLIERVVDENDRRSKLIVLTPAGRTAVTSIFALLGDLCRDFMEGIGKSETLLMLDATDLMTRNLEKLRASRTP
jgi:MarR family transcriptional regulator for hemolysin